MIKSKKVLITVLICLFVLLSSNMANAQTSKWLLVKDNNFNEVLVQVEKYSAIKFENDFIRFANFDDRPIISYKFKNLENVKEKVLDFIKNPNQKFIDLTIHQ